MLQKTASSLPAPTNAPQRTPPLRLSQLRLEGSGIALTLAHEGQGLGTVLRQVALGPVPTPDRPSLFSLFGQVGSVSETQSRRGERSHPANKKLKVPEPQHRNKWLHQTLQDSAAQELPRNPG